MQKRILIILGHPSRERKTLCESIAEIYAANALKAGHIVETIKIASLNFDPVLHEGFNVAQEEEADIQFSRTQMLLADHWVIIYPLWMLMMPALLKGFFERTLIKFVFDEENKTNTHPKPLAGKTVRIIQTMGMPEIIYRWYFGQHGIKALKGILRLVGCSKINSTYFGSAESTALTRRQKYFHIVEKLGFSGL